MVARVSWPVHVTDTKELDENFRINNTKRIASLEYGLWDK